MQCHEVHGSSHRSERMEVSFEVSFLHEFQQYHDRVSDSHHSVQLDYVGVSELAQDGRLLEQAYLFFLSGLSVCGDVQVCMCVNILEAFLRDA